MPTRSLTLAALQEKSVLARLYARPLPQFVRPPPGNEVAGAQRPEYFHQAVDRRARSHSHPFGDAVVDSDDELALIGGNDACDRHQDTGPRISHRPLSLRAT